MAAELRPAAAQVRTVGKQLDSASDDLADISKRLAVSAEKVASISTDIDDAKATIDTLPGLVAEVQRSVETTQDRLAVDIWLIRLLIVALLCAVLAAAYVADRGLVALGAGGFDPITPEGVEPDPR